MLVILAVLIFFMFRNSRKRKQQQEELQAQIVPGVEIMTNFGLFGTLKSIDEVANSAEIEVSPGTVLKVHRQTIARVVNNDEVEPGTPRSVEEAMEIANREAEERERAKLNEDSATPLADPAFGERVEPDSKKPARGSSKKATE
jgi:preprotein translocase subunit YajC